ncbi:uncharacterized protein Tco025E_06543 [Trypanosoma conorhini]|uniref:Uncharacterized protein n=1 Tax=Trypanosoma conorhini TaxID=83891 RepID=A0A3R7MVK2_9TRYP|nr:uncharacterized protein Tco025E_06543 [Trypanosoma conorhini]RNF11973.1 hypothetical protein Tco025E_06543 [Trypanosoma conorhini]
MLRRLAVGPGVLLHLRFDGAAGEAGRGPVRYKRLPASMQPKPLAENFTPFPLPKYDEDLGYGPVRLRNIPDIEEAKKRQQQRGAALMEAALREGGEAREQTQLRFKEEGSMLASSSHDDPSPVDATEGVADEDTLGGYTVSRHYPLIDRLECNRSLEDLLLQFVRRPQVEARCAALADMASTIAIRSDAELTRMFEEVSSPFAHDGRGLNFLVTTVRKFGRPYGVTNSLVTAYVNLMHAATVTFLQEQPWRLSRCPALTIQLLHFMALIKVFEPNKWFTSSVHAPSNRADYKHPRGTNQTTAFWGTGEAVFDAMVNLVRRDEHDGVPHLLELCTDEELVDLLNGFSAVMPSGTPIGGVFKSIMDCFLRRVRSHAKRALTMQDMATMERMYLTSVMADASSEELLQLLLADSSCPRGPNFFAALSRGKATALNAKTFDLLQTAIDAASANHDTATLLALLESGSEALLSMTDKERAQEFAMRNHFDYHILRSFRHFALVADRLRMEQPSISARIPRSIRDVQAQLFAANAAKLHSVDAHAAVSAASMPGYVSPHPTRRLARPLMTMLSQLEYLNTVDSVFLLHSSLMASSTDQLVSAVRRLPSGKDSLIVSLSCLRELSVKAATSAKPREREACERALEILAYEVEKGRVVLLPFSEELRLHDAGTYCDEDLILWTIAAFFAREMPLVKVHTLMHSDCTARTPYRFLKGRHNLLTSSRSLHDKDAPLLSALHSKELKLVTRNVKLRTALRDRKCTLYHYNPIRARFVYRRDKAMFDKYHTTARHLAPGFSRGALHHDWRGLGVYTPDHPQVPYRRLPWKQREATLKAA